MIARVLVLTIFAFITSTSAGTSINLTKGKGLQSGNLTPLIKYQASGILQTGSCSEDVGIKNCYTMFLSADGDLAPLKRDGTIPTLQPLDQSFGTHESMHEVVKRASPRQRIEFLSWPPSVDGQTNLYKWKYHLVPGVTTSSHFFHLVQLFSRTLAAFVIALDIKNDKLLIVDNVRKGCGNVCPSIPIEQVWGKTLYMRLLVTWGPKGSIKFTIQEAGKEDAENILEYEVVEGNVPAGGSLKTGLYRAVVKDMSDAKAYIGDFDFSERGPGGIKVIV